MNALRTWTRVSRPGVTLWLVGTGLVFADVAETVEPAGPAAAFPNFPAATLAKPAAVEEQSDPLSYWTSSANRIADLAGSESDPLKKSRFLLAGANLILARQVEPYCSRALAGVDGGQRGADRETIEPLLEKAQKMIAEADGLLASIPTPEKPLEVPEEGVPQEPAPSELSQLQHARVGLRAFLDAVRVYLLGEGEPGDMRSAASALAPMLEDPDRSVAAAARLWQALLRGLESGSTAPLKILGYPSTSLHADTWPFGLFSRVLRCRLQGMQGAWSTAMVSLLQLEEQLEELVPQVAHRGDARRLFAYVRLEILKLWYDALPPGQEKERAWCVAQAEEIVKLYFGVETTLLRLEPAIPTLVSLERPEVEKPKAEPE